MPKRTSNKTGPVTAAASRRGPRAELPLAPVMGHRGACAHAPENTLASIRQAAALGVGWVEFDVMLTGDGVPVLFHDDSLERITGRRALMAETPFADLAGLDAGSWFAAEFEGERIPSLRAAVALLLQLDLHPNVEIKSTPGRDVETAIAALETLGEVWPGDRPPPLISSFSRMSLAAARTLRPDWPRAMIAHKIPADWQTALQALDCQAFHVNCKVLTRAFISQVKASGRQVATFTVNDAKKATELYESGIDSVISDAPERIAGAYAKSRRPA